MPKIHKLSREEAQKIAAGEVVERPASVVKELVENSIDAGATAITVTIEDGGKQLIACRDNGCGMDPVDARLCIEPHATSKITQLDDLFALHTFGFRGEALASLAAISRLIITTKNAERVEGLRINIEHGSVAQETIVAHETGTLVEVKELFKTVPARLKFLKKNDTEMRHIAQLFDALFLPHPAVHAKLIIDGTIHKNYPATKTMHERAEQILMHKAHTSLLPVVYEKNGITIEGAVSNHQTYRFDKNLLYIFVNRRWVKNIALSRAVMRAYTALPDGKFPITSMHITVAPAIIDVNIHPRKEEVAFTNGVPVEHVLTHAIKEALEKELHTHVAFPQLTKTATWAPILQPTFATHTSPKVFASVQPQSAPAPIPAVQQKVILPAAEEETPPCTILGQLDTTYILATTEEGLTIVDQHAAHERILYEQFAARFGSIDTVHLLFPEIVHVSAADYELVLAYQELLTQHGIVAEPFGAQQIRVTALPIFAKHIRAQEIISSLITMIHDIPVKADAHQFLTNGLRAQMACKAAVKAGDTLSTQQMEQLFRDLTKTPNKLTCPHGRPTYWVITIAELEKKFQRTK